jgi:hypothetical protein
MPCQKNVYLLPSLLTSSGAYQVSCSMGTRGSFPGVRRPGSENDHSPMSNVKVKIVLVYTFTLS